MQVVCSLQVERHPKRLIRSSEPLRPIGYLSCLVDVSSSVYPRHDASSRKLPVSFFRQEGKDILIPWPAGIPVGNAKLARHSRATSYRENIRDGRVTT